MRIGDVLSEAWGLYKRFFGQFFLTALVVFVVLDLLAALVDRASGDNTSVNVFWALLGALISVVGYFWVQAALIDYLVQAHDRNAVSAVRQLSERSDLNPAVLERAHFALQQLTQ